MFISFTIASELSATWRERARNNCREYRAWRACSLFGAACPGITSWFCSAHSSAASTSGSAPP
eukprot:2484410-Amphidinium_carterae.1